MIQKNKIYGIVKKDNNCVDVVVVAAAVNIANSDTKICTYTVKRKMGKSNNKTLFLLFLMIVMMMKMSL